MNDEDLLDYLDRHHVDEVRTHATTLDGPGVGQYIHREKFFHCLPAGHVISARALEMDIYGAPHTAFGHSERPTNSGEVYLRPDLGTLISDGTDAKVGHIICDFTNAVGQPLKMCPRSTLKTMVQRLSEQNIYSLATCHLEFFLFRESFDQLKQTDYCELTPLSANQPGGLSHIRNAFLVKPFMDEVIKRIEWKGIAWEAWNDEAGAGQIGLSLAPNDPVKMADTVVRVKQVIYEVACDLNVSASFMPQVTQAGSPQPASSGMRIQHHLVDANGESAFYDESSIDKQSPLMKQWTAGNVASMKSAISYLCPTINAYRRFQNASGLAADTLSWLADSKRIAIKTRSDSLKTCRIEHHLVSSDANPYLVLATIYAGGLAGIAGRLELAEQHQNLAQGLSCSQLDLPNTMQLATDTLRQDDILNDAFGNEQVEYWAQTREHEWDTYQRNATENSHAQTSLWEFQRYFENV
ncbi:MAG: hypothetical protein P8N51_09345 [Pseudomonadales bacterium]|nr:hypothetical protein [Pseudomonadales bacterium]MDG1443280.1 hypothetical protein [Pseudomonadales bacterium]